MRTLLAYLTIGLYGAALAVSITTVATPCASDDGAGEAFCRWDAAAQGDGNGRSFIVIAGQVVSL